MWGVIVTPRAESVLPGFVSVLDYGIRGDGVTDCSSTLNALITDVANRGGGVIYFPPGTYIVESDVTLRSNVSLKGAGTGVTTIKGDNYSRYLIALVNNVTISDIAFENIQLRASSLLRPGIAKVVIERCQFKNHDRALIEVSSGETATEDYPGLVIRDTAFIRTYWGSDNTLVRMEYQRVPVLIENCSFITTAFQDKTWTNIVLSGFGFTLRNIRWKADAGYCTLVSTSAPTTIDGVCYDVSYDTKTLVDITSSNAIVVLRNPTGNDSGATFKLATTNPNNLVVLDEMTWRGRSTSGYSLNLAVQRSTTSTSAVTLKSFKVNLSGEIQVKAYFGPQTSGTSVWIGFYKNGTLVWSSLASALGWTADVNIPVSRDDLIEIRGYTTSSSVAMNLQQVVVSYIPYRGGDFYDVID